MWKFLKITGAARRFWASGGAVTAFVIFIGGAGLAQAAANLPVVSAKSLTKDTTPTWSWSTGGGGNGQYRYKLDNQNLSTGATETALTAFTPASPLSEGKHILYVQEKDGTSVWSASGKKAVIIDITPPNPPAVAGKTPTRDTTPAWTWVSGGGNGNGTFRYKLDNSNMAAGAIVGSATAYTPPAPLTEGKHILYVQERDAAGNWSALGKKAIIVDLTPPESPVVDGTSPTTDTTPTWTWAAGGGGSGAYRYKLDEANLKVGATLTTLLTFTPDNPLAEDEHTLYVQERDKAGNWSVAGSRAILVEAPPPNPLPDTGQTKCYNNSAEIPCPTPGQAFHGQDANYTINPPSYTDQDNGTVTNNVTGLTWQRDDVVRAWADAVSYCEDLTLAGYNDWRLPSDQELIGIVDYGKPWPSPTIDTAAFPGTDSYPYWSSTTRENKTDFAWHVDFNYGGINHEAYKSNFFYARCVRGGQDLPHNYTIHGDGTVTDNGTSLMWQQKDDNAMRSWDTALAYCEGLNLAGYDDWRLPNLKELKSLTDSSRSNPAIELAAFPDTNSSYYWSSTTSRNGVGSAWQVYFGNGTFGQNGKSYDMYARCVRGGQ